MGMKGEKLPVSWMATKSDIIHMTIWLLQRAFFGQALDLKQDMVLSKTGLP